MQVDEHGPIQYAYVMPGKRKKGPKQEKIRMYFYEPNGEDEWPQELRAKINTDFPATVHVFKNPYDEGLAMTVEWVEQEGE